MNRSIVATNVRRIMAERGYKQRAVAKIAGYDEKAFSNMLTGRKCIYDHDIVALSCALHVSPNDLFQPINSMPCDTVPIDAMKQAFSECLDAFRKSNNKEE